MKRFTVYLCAACAVLLLLPGCAALREYAALQNVDWSFENVTDVRLANISITEAMDDYSDLGMVQLTTLMETFSRGELPLELVAHLGAHNPETNGVSARLMDLDWTAFIQNKRTVGGRLGNSYTLQPGTTTDIPVTVQLDLFEFFEGSAQEAFDLALAVAGRSTKPSELRLELVPTIETALGPMTYGSPIVLRRTVGE